MIFNRGGLFIPFSREVEVTVSVWHFIDHGPVSFFFSRGRESSRVPFMDLIGAHFILKAHAKINTGKCLN